MGAHLSYVNSPSRVEASEKTHLNVKEDFVDFLIHEANPQSRPGVIVVFAHVARPSVRPSVRPRGPLFKTQQISSENNVCYWWIWPSGSLMTPVFFCLALFSNWNPRSRLRR